MKNLKHRMVPKVAAGLLAVAAVLVQRVGVASAQANTAVSSSISDGQQAMVAYATAALTAVTLVTAIAIGIRLVPKLWRKIAGAI